MRIVGSPTSKRKIDKTEKYKRILSSAGLSLINNYIDEGENYYYVAKK